MAEGVVFKAHTHCNGTPMTALVVVLHCCPPLVTTPSDVFCASVPRWGFLFLLHAIIPKTVGP